MMIPGFGGFVGGYAAYESPKSGYFHSDSHRAKPEGGMSTVIIHPLKCGIAYENR